jgi:chromosome segregation ATPase
MGKVDDMKRRVSKAEHGATAVGAEAVLETTMKLQSHYEKRESVLREQFQDKLQAQGVPKEAQHEIVSLRRACMKLESELDEAKDARSTLDRTLMDLKISAVKTQGTIHLLKTERDDLQAELDRVQKLLVVAEADATRAAGNLTNDRARFGRQIQQLKAKLTRLEQS